MNPWEIDVVSGTDKSGAGPRLDYHDKVVVLDVNRLGENPSITPQKEASTDFVVDETMNLDSFKLSVNDILSFNNANDSNSILGLNVESVNQVVIPVEQSHSEGTMQFNAVPESGAVVGMVDDSVFTPYF